MKLFNKIFTLFLNALIMGLVIMIMKTQDDMRLGASKNSVDQYNGLIDTNKTISLARTDQINNILEMVKAGKLATSTTQEKMVAESAVKTTTSNPVPAPVVPQASAPVPIQAPVVSVPQPVPVVTAPAPAITPTRTTRTS